VSRGLVRGIVRAGLVRGVYPPKSPKVSLLKQLSLDLVWTWGGKVWTKSGLGLLQSRVWSAPGPAPSPPPARPIRQALGRLLADACLVYIIPLLSRGFACRCQRSQVAKRELRRAAIQSVVPYRVQKPYIIVNGQKLVSPTAVPQRLPFCDRCGELAATSASLYTELALDKWWRWFSCPRFSCQPEAFMGCERHPVESEICFLDGRVEPFIRLPLTRWQQLFKWDAFLMAAVLALFFAVIVELLLHHIRR
jgi:hypothetical protein